MRFNKHYINFRNIAVNSGGVKITEPGVKAVNLKSWKEIPGPSSLPFIGPTLNFLPIIGTLSILQNTIFIYNY